MVLKSAYWPDRFLLDQSGPSDGLGIVVVMDEKVSEAFHPDAGDVERLMYGFSNFICLPDGMAHLHSRGTGTVMRPSTLRAYAVEAGFSDVEVLPIETDTFRFYRLVTLG